METTANNSNKKVVAPKQNKKKILLIISSMLTLLVVLIGLFFTGVLKVTNPSVTKKKICDDNFIKKYNDTKNVSILAGNWSGELAKLSEEVRQSGGDYYEEDVDCLYILVQDSIEQQQWSNAQYYAQKIKDKTAESDKNKISPKLSSVSPDGLIKYVDYVFAVSGDEVDKRD